MGGVFFFLRVIVVPTANEWSTESVRRSVCVCVDCVSWGGCVEREVQIGNTKCVRQASVDFVIVPSLIVMDDAPSTVIFYDRRNLF